MTNIVTFIANSGTVGEETREVEDGTAIGALPEPVRKGYKCLGWWTANSGGERVTANTVVTGDMTLYARWTAAWTVTLNANGGALEDEEDGGLGTSRPTVKVLVQKSKAVGTLAKPTRAGYSFKGWFTAKTKGTKITTKTKVTKNVTWYAQWKVKKYAVKVTKVGKGTVTGTGSKAYKSKVTLKAKAAKGYVLQGWFEATDGGEKFLSRKASYSFKVPVGGRTLIVKFLTTAQDKAGIGLTFDGVGVGAAADSAATSASLPCLTNMCGVVIEAVPIVASGLTPVSVKVAGLPTGLKYDAKKKAITGTPTVAKSFTAKITVKSLGASRSWSVKWVIVPLPTWAVGTFKGTAYAAVEDDRPPEAKGTMTLTVGKSGKISGKFVVAGKQYSFTAPSFAEYGPDGVLATTKGTMKYGNKTYRVEIAVAEGDSGGGIAEVAVLNGTAEIASGTLAK